MTRQIGTRFGSVDFDLYNNDVALVAECAAFTDPSNIAHAVVADYILNSDEEWNDADIVNDENRILQNIAHAAKTINELKNTQISDEQISFLNDEFEREQLLADLEKYMSFYSITLQSLASGRWLGEGIQIISLNDLNNEELKYALAQLYERQKDLKEAAEADEEYKKYISAYQDRQQLMRYDYAAAQGDGRGRARMLWSGSNSASGGGGGPSNNNMRLGGSRKTRKRNKKSRRRNTRRKTKNYIKKSKKRGKQKTKTRKH